MATFAHSLAQGLLARSRYAPHGAALCGLLLSAHGPPVPTRETLAPRGNPGRPSDPTAVRQNRPHKTGRTGPENPSPNFLSPLLTVTRNGSSTSRSFPTPASRRSWRTRAGEMVAPPPAHSPVRAFPSRVSAPPSSGLATVPFSRSSPVRWRSASPPSPFAFLLPPKGFGSSSSPSACRCGLVREERRGQNGGALCRASR